MSDFISFLCLLSICIFTCWLASKLFSCVYAAIALPLVGAVSIAKKIIPEEYQNRMLAGISIVSYPAGYYLSCIWPAFVVSYVLVPNLSTASWWLYGIALAGFCIGAFADGVTFTAFVIFCFKPELIQHMYAWLPWSWVT